MSAKQSNAREKELQLVRVAELWARGLNTEEIATLIERTSREIRRDIATLKARWAASLKDHDEIRKQQLAELGQMKREAWIAWDKSKRERIELITSTRTRNSQVVGLTDKRLFQELPNGDPRYMGILLSAIEAQNKLLGLIVSKNANTNTDGSDVAAPTTESERIERILQVFEQARQGDARLLSDAQNRAADVDADSGAADDGAVERGG